MKFYKLPTCLCKVCKGPTKVVEVMFSASDKVCLTIKCLHCHKVEDAILSFQDIVGLYYKSENKSDSMVFKGDDTVVH